MKNLILTLLFSIPAFLFSQKKFDTTYHIVVTNSQNIVANTFKSQSHYKIKMINGDVIKGEINFINDSQFIVEDGTKKVGLIRAIDYIKQIKTGKRVTGITLLSASTIMAIKGLFISDKKNGIVTEDVIDYMIGGAFAAASIPFFINKKYSTKKYQFKVQRIIVQNLN